MLISAYLQKFTQIVGASIPYVQKFIHPINDYLYPYTIWAKRMQIIHYRIFMQFLFAKNIFTAFSSQHFENEIIFETVVIFISQYYNIPRKISMEAINYAIGYYNRNVQKSL